MQIIFPFASRGFPKQACLLLAMSMALLGCGRTGPKNVAVTGDVTYHGKPVGEASILFISTNTRPTDGSTDAEGRFAMKAIVDGNGDSAHEQTVCVTKTVIDPTARRDEMYPAKLSVIPTRYGTPVQSPLKARISDSGPNEFHFELTD
jgi:hypothetical protein